MGDKFKTLPPYNLKLYKGFWNFQDFQDGGILAQRRFKARPSDVLLSGCPKTGTTWLKALAFAIVTREKFDESTSPLLTTLPHECIPLLEQDLAQIENNQKKSCFVLVATHLPYSLLPESVITSNCKIVYIYRNIKDVIVSYYHMMLKAQIITAPFEQVVDDYCEGKSCYGPYWDHILGYWKASELGRNIIFLKYEDMKSDATSNMKRLAEFIEYPFSIEEEKAGVVENIIKLCSFENLSNLEVNKTGKHRPETPNAVENQVYFRKAKVGDWENYLTDEMKEKIDKLIDEKLSGTGLDLKQEPQDLTLSVFSE